MDFFDSIFLDLDVQIIASFKTKKSQILSTIFQKNDILI